MRTLYRVLAGLLLISQTLSTHAQVFSFGIKGGITYANISGNYSLINEYKTGLNSGVFANFNFTKNVGVVSEINYEQKGFKYNNGNFNNQVLRINGEKRFDYFTIPIFFKYQLGSKLKFYFNIGTYMGILLYANDNGFLTDYSTSPETTSQWNNNIYFDTQDVDIGLCFGAGFQIPVNKRIGILFETRYNSGLLLIEPDKIFVEEYQNKDLSLNLGLAYHLLY